MSIDFTIELNFFVTSMYELFKVKSAIINNIVFDCKYPVDWTMRRIRDLMTILARQKERSI